MFGVKSFFSLLQGHFRRVIRGRTQKGQLHSFRASPAVRKCLECHLGWFFRRHISAQDLHRANHYVCTIVSSRKGSNTITQEYLGNVQLRKPHLRFSLRIFPCLDEVRKLELNLLNWIFFLSMLLWAIVFSVLMAMYKMCLYCKCSEVNIVFQDQTAQ